MATKPGALTSDMLAKKGAASVPNGAPQRGSDAEEVTAVPNPLVPLNFRVPADFREAFETYAFNSKPRRKMVSLLKDAFAALKEKEGANR